MELFANWKQHVTSAIAYAYGMLFAYAAFAKLFDFDNFRVQLGQSPLLSAFASYIAFAVPISELIIVALVLTTKFRLLALFCCYTLMAMFTAYIYIILNYSAFVPCSCGGILEKMTWTQHLVFNVAFLFLAFLAILIMPTQPSLKAKQPVQ